MHPGLFKFPGETREERKQEAEPPQGSYQLQKFGTHFHPDQFVQKRRLLHRIPDNTIMQRKINN